MALVSVMVGCKVPLEHLLGEPILPKPMMTTVTIVIPKPNTGEAPSRDVMLPILLPHEVLSHVCHNHPSSLTILYMGDTDEQDTPGKLEEFGIIVEAKQDPSVLEHPMKSTRRWKT